MGNRHKLKYVTLDVQYPSQLVPTLLVTKNFKPIERFLSFLSARLKKRAWKDLYLGRKNLFIFYLFVS